MAPQLSLVPRSLPECLSWPLRHPLAAHSTSNCCLCCEGTPCTPPPALSCPSWARGPCSLPHGPELLPHSPVSKHRLPGRLSHGPLPGCPDCLRPGSHRTLSLRQRLLETRAAFSSSLGRPQTRASLRNSTGRSGPAALVPPSPATGHKGRPRQLPFHPALPLPTPGNMSRGHHRPPLRQLPPHQSNQRAEVVGFPLWLGLTQCCVCRSQATCSGQ